ncbi:MAG: nicotinate-nucleotide adenylyltransferase [Pyrinomonadaceae bacterium]
MSKIAFYGGSFDPVHRGHIAIASKLTEIFGLDAFVFVPAFHAPHKRRTKPTPGFHRYAMLCLATNDETAIRVSSIELDAPERPYTIETLSQLKTELPDDEVFFVMGADSWAEITTWYEWRQILSVTHHIVVSRPGYEMGIDHVTDDIRERIVDLRNRTATKLPEAGTESRIFFTDSVTIDISSTSIRDMIRENDAHWQQDVPALVAKYIKKYQIYYNGRNSGKVTHA